MNGFITAAVFLLLTCRMEAPALSGRILKADGSPAPQVEVFLAGLNGFRFPRSAWSDGDGRYRIEVLPAGLQTFEASDNTLGKGAREIEIGPGENRLDITLSEELVARGRVVDPDGDPVADAKVEAGVMSVRTDAQGSFSILVDEDGYELVAQKAGFSPAYLNRWTAGGARLGLELRLGHEASISGRLLGLDPGQVEETEVVATSLLHPQMKIPGQVSPDGTYRVPGLAPGEWFLSADLDDRSAEATVTIVPEKPEVVQNLSLLRTEVRGRVVDATGEPAGEVEVGLVDPEHEFWTTTKPDGSFSLPVADGAYEILAVQEDFAATRGGAVTVAGEPVEGLEIRLEAAPVLTVRLLGIPEEERENLNVHVQIELEAYQHRAEELEIARNPGEPLVYRFDDFGPGPGAWTVRARVNAEEVVRRFKVRPGDRTIAVDLPFSFGNLSLSGHITGYRIPEDGLVWLRKVGNDRSSWIRHVEDGTFLYSRLRPGRYVLTLIDDRKETVLKREIDLTSSQELEIDLGDLGSPD